MSAHGVASWSNSLSLMMLMILPSIHVPSTKGTRLEKADQLGMTKNTTSSSYPAASRSRIKKDSCIGFLFPPGPLDYLPAPPMGELDNLAHSQTLVLLYSPATSCSSRMTSTIVSDPIHLIMGSDLIVFMLIGVLRTLIITSFGFLSDMAPCF